MSRGSWDPSELEAISYGPDDTRPHVPADDAAWQESFVVSWWDDDRGVGGFHRIGQQPAAGTASVLCGVVSTEGTRFRRTDEHVALSPTGTDRDAFAAGPAHRVRFSEGLCFEVDEPDCEMVLHFEDFYPAYNYWALTSDSLLSADIAPDHYQIAGRVHGSLRLGDRELSVDGLGHRDHSWGARHWTALVGHRWLAGTMGPQFSFSMITSHLATGELSRVGMVVRDGEVATLGDVDIVVHLEPDGLTHRGGTATARLPDGEELAFEAETVDGIVTSIRGLSVVDGLGRVRVGEMTGFCDLEQSNNAEVRRQAVPLALRAINEEGLSVRA